MFSSVLIEGSEVDQVVIERSEKDSFTTLAVLQMAGTWRVLRDGQQFDCFDDPASAARCALDIAESVRSQGRLVEILIHDRFGELRALRPKVH